MTTFLRAVPYGKDALRLPVADVESAIPYYERSFGLRVVSQREAPMRAVLFERDKIQVGLEENGGDPTQDGCFFEVDDVTAAHAEMAANGASPGIVDAQRINGKSFRAFFVVAPDGLCYMIAQREM